MASEDIEAARDSVQKKIDKREILRSILTGLRCNELRSITLGQLHLDDKTPSLRSDLASELHEWIERTKPDSELESWGYQPVGGDIEKLYELASLTGRNADQMTYKEIVQWAIELKREATIRRQVETDSSTNVLRSIPTAPTSKETKACWICSCRIDSGTICNECRRREGKMIDLQIAINQDYVERIEEWPPLRAMLKSKFGFDKDVHALWENMIDWLWSNNGLDENDVINLRIADVPKLLEFHGNEDSDSGETPSSNESKVQWESWSDWMDKSDIVDELKLGVWKTLVRNNGNGDGVIQVENSQDNPRKGRFRKKQVDKLAIETGTSGISGHAGKSP